jgi:hypothetical protein
MIFPNGVLLFVLAAHKFGIFKRASYLMALMARVTHPSGDTRQPPSNSIKVARERGGIAERRKLIHKDKLERTRVGMNIADWMGVV